MTSPDRTEDTRDKVLSVVCELLWRVDEGSLRLADVCEATGLSSSVVYKNFRSRQGLVDAAYLEIYRTVTAELIEVLRRGTKATRDLSELRQYLRDEFNSPLHQALWRKSRHMRLRIATAAVARASLQRDFAVLQDQYLGELAEIFADLQLRGVVGRMLSASQLAIMFEGNLLVHSFNDIALQPEDDQSWFEMLWIVLGAGELEHTS